jgi:hypothetical protein
MKNRFLRTFLGVFCALSASSWITGCMTGEDKVTLDGIAGSSTQPYVEAFIEYRGPQERWSGPTAWTLQVVAKDNGPPEITVPLAWRQEENSTARKPAAQTVTAEEARVKIGALAATINEPDTGFSGCMYPIHARLIRADGKVLDKQGCRGQSHWDQAASGLVDYFMAAAGK